MELLNGILRILVVCGIIYTLWGYLHLWEIYYNDKIILGEKKWKKVLFSTALRHGLVLLFSLLIGFLLNN